MSNQLLVKNLPQEFSDLEKTDFLKLFGASDVTCLAHRGQLKNCCFVQFLDDLTAKQALFTLHQFEVLGQRLVAEYAKSAHAQLAAHIQARNVLQKQSNVNFGKTLKTSGDETVQLTAEKISTGICPQQGVNHDFPQHLNYAYPSASVTVLTNIANAMATVPKFYTQVLHLMNKMNLPPPFSGPTPSPPMIGDTTQLRDACVDTSDLAEWFASSEESELDTDAEESSVVQTHAKLYATSTAAEPIRRRKRLKAAAKVEQDKISSVAGKAKSAGESIESAFELPLKIKRVDGKLAASIQEAVGRKHGPAVGYNVFDEREKGFGKLEPVRKDDFVPSDESGTEDEEESPDYISARKLRENRITETEILSMSQFKNYERGETTNRLYVKNLAKQTSEQDLQFIFKRFLRGCASEDQTEFEIKLMQEGRMKGQAFVTLPTKEVAEKALTDVHGYVLNAKPMVIQFARSSKK